MADAFKQVDGQYCYKRLVRLTEGAVLAPGTSHDDGGSAQGCGSDHREDDA